MSNVARVITAIGIGLGFGISFQLGAGAAAYKARSVTGANQAAPQRGLGGFTEPAPLDFDDHEGYVSIFDGRSLKGWDGHPKFWRVENGAIVGESTAANPSGNSYIVYRELEAKDFTLKFEIRVE